MSILIATRIENNQTDPNHIRKHTRNTHRPTYVLIDSNICIKILLIIILNTTNQNMHNSINV